jgi:hypothetical protein
MTEGNINQDQPKPEQSPQDVVRDAMAPGKLLIDKVIHDEVERRLSEQLTQDSQDTDKK